MRSRWTTEVLEGEERKKVKAQAPMAVVFVNLLRLSPSHHRMMDFAERPVTSAFGYPLLARSVNGRKLFATQLDSRRGLKPSATVCPFKGVEITSRGVNERSERVKR